MRCQGAKQDAKPNTETTSQFQWNANAIQQDVDWQILVEGRLPAGYWKVECYQQDADQWDADQQDAEKWDADNTTSDFRWETNIDQQNTNWRTLAVDKAYMTG